MQYVDNDENIEEIKTVEFHIDKTKPEITADVNPKTIWPPNGKMVDVKITGSVNDDNPYETIILVEDEYDLVEPSLTIYEAEISQTIKLQASRRGNDRDGRKYTIKLSASDLAGNTSIATFEVIVPHSR